MGVSERLMHPGSFTLSLIAETPPSTLTPLLYGDTGEGGYFGHIIITPVRLSQIFPDAIMLANSQYTGVVRGTKRETGSATDITGAGLITWLGDENGKGDIPEVAIDLSGMDFDTAVNAVLPAAIVAGSITNPSALTLPPGLNGYLFVYETARHRLGPAEITDPIFDVGTLMTYFGTEYRVNPDATLDAGLATVLFPTVTTPTVIVTRKPGGKDPTINVLETTSLPIERDVESYGTRAIVTTRIAEDLSIAVGADDIPTPTPYKDLFGNDVILSALFETSVPEGSEQQLAEQLALQLGEIRTQIKVSAATHTIGRLGSFQAALIQVGDAIWVYDREAQIFDLSNQIRDRGEIFYPVSLRVYAAIWPIKQGMGVYFRDKNGVYTDLTDFVAWEEGDVQFEVGAPDRSIGLTGGGSGLPQNLALSGGGENAVHFDIGQAIFPDGTGTGNDPATPAKVVSTGAQTANTPKVTYFVLAFDQTTEEHVMWQFRVPSHFATSSVYVSILWGAAVTSGEVVWKAALLATAISSTDMDAAVFSAAALSGDHTVPATAGQYKESQIDVTTAAAGLASGEIAVLMVGRDAGNVSDDAGGDATILSVSLHWT